MHEIKPLAQFPLSENRKYLKGADESKQAKDYLRDFLDEAAFLDDPWPGSPGAVAQCLSESPAQSNWWVLSTARGIDWLTGIEHLAFDSEIFGTRLGRLYPFLHCSAWPEQHHLNQGLRIVQYMLAMAKEQELKGLVARVSCRDMTGAEVLERAGFSLKDISIEWMLDLKKFSGGSKTENIRPWQEPDRKEILELAGSAFCVLDDYADRFALDSRLRAGCPEMYRRWAVNSLNGSQADQVLVWEQNDEVQGFITLRLPSPKPPGENCGWIVLNAIKKQARGQGGYNTLLAAGLNWLKSQGVSAARVRTKISQNAVVRAWSRLGARQVYADMTFHLWLDQNNLT